MFGIGSVHAGFFEEIQPADDANPVSDVAMNRGHFTVAGGFDQAAVNAFIQFGQAARVLRARRLRHGPDRLQMPHHLAAGIVVGLA
jgi:hypothetical protein